MQVSKHVHALKIPFNITIDSGKKLERFVYCFIIFGSKIHLVDSGVSSSEKLIFDYIRQKGRNPEDIASLTLTHSHPDHIGAAKSIRDFSGCTIIAHENEKDWIENTEKQFADRPVPGFSSLVGGSVPVDKTVEHGEEINLEEGLRLHVIHTPGHSRGSISMSLDYEDILFSGDVIPLPGDMPIYDDPLVLIESIEKLQRLKNRSILLSSWDEPRVGNLVDTIISDGIKHLRQLHNSVMEVATNQKTVDSLEMSKIVLHRVGLPTAMASIPLVVRSLSSSIKYI
ncbi:MBL fold metallo-hydrolase [Heliobacterium undosum]|uniref:MBL fold metallo-hydrolase n=1 Tax=Heliomicrobium undosum TaxID=121734 RepID=A0A845KYT5_9FIRM|nr:MBL fold metallo-hydrolase [Heliomicrobium undosum]MZP28753.1 MBL fold metallo-hydrolase [Heliomicrobium undosum]